MGADGECELLGLEAPIYSGVGRWGFTQFDAPRASACNSDCSNMEFSPGFGWEGLWFDSMFGEWGFDLAAPAMSPIVIVVARTLSDGESEATAQFTDITAALAWTVTQHVNYNGHTVSDPRLRDALVLIAFHYLKEVRVTSGDRKSPLPYGAGQASPHLRGMAVDFRVVGMSNEAAFGGLTWSDSPVFYGFRLIYHGPFTNTSASHLHLGSNDI